ncbi:KRAB [Lepeophtheirus salmonis]|uniref:KRAB n=1 Tax=Lepeophtheirus salmonis TaxID=72036 RepID=A0A7R8CC21_LEPSM|nr:KRAB [Lepeophtheirus salmonis]CAF2766575.1 KRAB [Lepeophtheirus salmonis]
MSRFYYYSIMVSTVAASVAFFTVIPDNPHPELKKKNNLDPLGMSSQERMINMLKNGPTDLTKAREETRILREALATPKQNNDGKIRKNGMMDESEKSGDSFSLSGDTLQLMGMASSLPTSNLFLHYPHTMWEKDNEKNTGLHSPAEAPPPPPPHKPHICNICSKRFAKREHLTKHLRIHKSDNKRYSCEFCYKAFRDRYELVRHTRRHTGDFPHRCTECDKGFMRHERYLTHLRWHSGERPYQCSMCEKSFRDRSELNRHSRRHTGDLPYKCETCGKEKPFVCAVCSRGYRDKRELKKHQAAHNHSGLSDPIPPTNNSNTFSVLGSQGSKNNINNNNNNSSVLNNNFIIKEEVVTATPTKQSLIKSEPQSPPYNSNNNNFSNSSSPINGIHLPNEPIPKEELEINGNPQEIHNSVAPLNPATIPLPPSVASALQLINEKVVAKQRAAAAAAASEKRMVTLVQVPSSSAPNSSSTSITTTAASSSLLSHRHLIKEEDESSENSPPMLYYVLPGMLNLDGGSTVRVQTGDGRMSTGQIVNVSAFGESSSIPGIIVEQNGSRLSIGDSSVNAREEKIIKKNNVLHFRHNNTNNDKIKDIITSLKSSSALNHKEEFLLLKGGHKDYNNDSDSVIISSSSNLNKIPSKVRRVIVQVPDINEYTSPSTTTTLSSFPNFDGAYDGSEDEKEEESVVSSHPQENSKELQRLGKECIEEEVVFKEDENKMEEVTAAAAAAPKLSSEQEANSHDLKEQHSANDSSSILLASNSNCTETSMAASTSITPIITQPPIGCNSVSKSEEIFSSADGDGIFNDSSSRVHHLNQEQEHQQQTSLLSSPPRHTNNNNMNNSDDNNSSSTNEEDLNTSGEMSILSGSCSSSSNNSSLNNSSKGENYTCQFCSRCYTDKNRFEIHVRFHTGETPYVCPICNKGFRDGKKMKIHVGRHTSSLTHKCHLCPRSFEGPRALNKHLLAHKMKNYISPKSNKINQLKTSTPAPLPNIPPPRPPSDSTISLTMDDLIQYAQPLPEMHESVLQEKLIEGAAKVVPVTMEEFKTDSEFPDLLDSMSSVQDTYAKMNSIPVSSSDSHVSTPISCSGLSGSTPTFTTLSGVEPEYPAHLALKPNITGGPPIVLARKSAAPPPPPKAKKDSSHGSSKSSSLSSSKHTLVSQNIKQQISTTPNVPVLVSKPEALVTALASEAVAQLAKAKINLPAGTCIVPASASQKNESQESLVANPAIKTTSSVAVSDPKGGPPSTVPSQPMTITIQYKIYPDQKGEEPRTVSVKRDLADLIKETPARSSSQSSISSEKTVASPGVTPFPEINKVQIEPKKIDPAKETRPVITPAGNKYDVPTVVTGGYDLDNLMCTFCDRRFKNEKTLMGHMLNHFGVAPKMASCPECGLTLQKKSYARHLRLHGNIAPQVCTICKKEFREKRSLDKHIKVVHGGEQSYPCNYCPETFKTAIEQKNHVDSHVYQFDSYWRKKPFSCEICDKSFASEKVKRNHVLKHQGSLPHKCEVCYMTFQSKAHLVKHESKNDMQVIGFDNAESSSGIVTSGGMIFPENLDEAAAEAAQIFQNDILQSDGDDLLVNESFPEKVIPIINTLSSSSTEEENIIHCSMCTAKLNSKRSYLIHLKRHVGLNTFKCKYCDKSFQSKFRLNRHLKNHAKEGSNITPPPSSPTGEKSTDDAQIFETINLIRSAAYQRKLRRRSLFRRSYRLRSLHRAKHISSLDLNNNVYNCTVCCVSLKRKTSLFIHKMKHGGKSWRCDSCGDLFSHSSKLNSHLLENHDMLKKDIRSKGLLKHKCVDLGSNSFRTLEGPPPPIVVNATPVQGPTETTTMILQTPQISIPQPEVVSPVIQVLPVNVSDLYQGGNNISNVPTFGCSSSSLYDTTRKEKYSSWK